MLINLRSHSTVMPISKHPVVHDKYTQLFHFRKDISGEKGTSVVAVNKQEDRVWQSR